MAGALTCAEFMTMDPKRQVMVVKEMRATAEDMASDKMMPGDKTAQKRVVSTADMIPAILRNCEGNPSAMLMDILIQAFGD